MPHTIPFLDLRTPHHDLEEELVTAFRAALRSAQFIGGPEVEAFEGEFAAYCGTKHCVGVGSGTDALRFALIASGIRAGDAVITVAHTFIATVEAISQAGAETEFVDIDERTYTMSVQALREYLVQCRRDPATGRPIGQRTGKVIKALVPVHIYGHMAEMDDLLALAREHDLLVIEDACQAHGAGYKSADGVWRRSGAVGRAAAFSFYPGKNLGACGEAGAITTDDDNIAHVAKMLRDHGQRQKYYHQLEGYNGRLDAIQAAFLRVKLPRLDQWNDQRRSVAQRYDAALSNIPLLTRPVEQDRHRAVYHLYVVRARQRDRLVDELKARGVSTGLHYPVPVHLQQCYRHWGYRQGSLPITERAAAEIVSLPMFPGLAGSAQEHVISAVVDSLASTGLAAAESTGDSPTVRLAHS